MAEEKHKGFYFTQLFLDNSKESHLAESYLSNLGIKFSINYCESDDLWNKLYDDNVSCGFANSFKNPEIPCLTARFPCYLGPFAYVSLFGIEDFLRDVIIKDLNIKDNVRIDRSYLRNTNLYYGSKKQKLVSCFNKEREKIFEGPIFDSPYKFENQLDKHDFKDWHEVSCWEMGKLDDLTKKVNEKGIVADNDTRTVLFPYDIELLKNNILIPTTDSRCYMQVLFEGLFNDNGNVYGIYANMTD